MSWNDIVGSFQPAKAQRPPEGIDYGLKVDEIFTREPVRRETVTAQQWSEFESYQRRQALEQERLAWESDFRASHSKPKSQSKILRLAAATVTGFLVAKFGLHDVVSPEVQSVIETAIVSAGGAGIAAARIWFTDKFLS